MLSAHDDRGETLRHEALQILMRRYRVRYGTLSEKELKTLIRGGETNTVELKVAAP
jgi:hypothetical protein